MTLLLPERGDHLIIWSMSQRKKTARTGVNKFVQNLLVGLSFKGCCGRPNNNSRLEKFSHGVMVDIKGLRSTYLY